MVDIFKNLNQNQIEAVKTTEGRVRVVAGAGSGKTRVLAHRYAYLVREFGISSSNILCMTFTNKAAQEMKNRIAKLVDKAYVNDYICTIHSFCVKFLRKEIHRIGYPKNFAIIDSLDEKALAKDVMAEMELDDAYTVKQFLDEVEIYKSINPYIEQIILPDRKNQLEAKCESYIIRYILLQLETFSLDFKDLIEYTLYILNNFEDAKIYWQEQFNYIMVDEVQDCSRSDWKIIDILSQFYNNLFIVGDPDQSIYEWRGAVPENFINFKSDRDFILDENYRSTQNILNVANSIISNNKKRIPKNLYTQKSSDYIAVHFHGKSEEEEGNWIANQIKSLVKQGYDYGDFAVLYRASFISRVIEQALLKHHIKYIVWGGVRFFERKEIKDVLGYLRLISYKDDLSFKRIINTPSRKFGKVSLKKLQDLANEEKMLLYDTLVKYKDLPVFNKKSILDFINLIEECRAFGTTKSISDLLAYILDASGLISMYRKDSDQEQLDNISELINSIKNYEVSNAEEENLSLDIYLQDISLYTNADYKNSGTSVKLMTIHQSKGLEYPFVFVCNLTEGIFPSHRSIRERKRDGEEEERRLMYVAVTRAEKGLFLTESEGYNSSFKLEKYPSRFIKEIDENLIKVDGKIDPILYKGTEYLVNSIENEINPNDVIEGFNIGDRVKHKIFGEGEIVGVNNGHSYRINFNGKYRTILEEFLIYLGKK